MYIVGQKEIDAVARVLTSGKVFRYGIGGECTRFERRYARYLATTHCHMTASGSLALSAALKGLGIGPGDEVIVPAHTYMATALAVLDAGAIPIIADIDDSLTLCPQAVAAAAGPRTRAVMPVHMWGLPCDMDALMAVAKKHRLKVVEDACQAVGGGFEGRMLGAIGHAGAFSFNYYKNMTAGEGGAVVTNDAQVAARVSCVIDSCSYYWNGKDAGAEHFSSCGARASEIEGAILNAQLDRLPSMIRRMRREKARILRETADTGLRPARRNSPEWECGTHVMYTFASPEQAAGFAAAAGGGIAGRTGRHVYTDWAPVLSGSGGHHPALDPYRMAANRECRRTYSRDMCAKSLDILNRTAMLSTHPNHRYADVSALIRRVRHAAKAVL